MTCMVILCAAGAVGNDDVPGSIVSTLPGKPFFVRNSFSCTTVAHNVRLDAYTIVIKIAYALRI